MSKARGKGGAAVSHSKELMSLTYINALITPLGLNFNEPKIDNDGIDITIRGKGFSGHFPKPKIEVQLKCAQFSAIRIDTITKEIVYQLPVHNYNELIGPNILPSILVLHLVPNNQSDWMYFNKQSVILKHASYWLSLDGNQESTNTTNITVRIPLSQQLTPNSLMSMMEYTSAQKKITNNGGIF